MQHNAPEVLSIVVRKAKAKRTIQEGKLNNCRALEITGELSLEALAQYLTLRNEVARIQLQDMEEDQILWKWPANHYYSVQSAYRAYFIGTIPFPCYNLQAVVESLGTGQIPLLCSVSLE